jgi:hypothetical protein
MAVCVEKEGRMHEYKAKCSAQTVGNRGDRELYQVNNRAYLGGLEAQTDRLVVSEAL